jgi:hypothetical protein
MNGPNDDEQFALYLKSFQPLPAAPLPRRRQPWMLFAVAAAALVIAVLSLVPLRRAGQEDAVLEPNTIGGANLLLANSPSWKSAIDEAGFAFRPAPKPHAPNHRSALEILSQEHLKK